MIFVFRPSSLVKNIDKHPSQVSLNRTVITFIITSRKCPTSNFLPPSAVQTPRWYKPFFRGIGRFNLDFCLFASAHMIFVFRPSPLVKNINKHPSQSSLNRTVITFIITSRKYLNNRGFYVGNWKVHLSNIKSSDLKIISSHQTLTLFGGNYQMLWTNLLYNCLSSKSESFKQRKRSPAQIDGQQKQI